MNVYTGTQRADWTGTGPSCRAVSSDHWRCILVENHTGDHIADIGPNSEIICVWMHRPELNSPEEVLEWLET